MKYLQKYDRGIWWIKRDLRLLDNPALTEALQHCQEVLPVYVIEPEWLNSEDTSVFHTHAVMQALTDLRKRLHKKGAPLLILQGSLPEVWQFLWEKWDFEVLFSHQETGSAWSFSRDLQVKDWCRKRGIQWHEPLQTGVFRGKTNRDTREKRWHRFMGAAHHEIPTRIASPDMSVLHDLGIFEADICWPERLNPTQSLHPDVQHVSERMAHRTLQTFLTERGYGYSGGISSPNTAFTAGSRLSTHLAWGTLSPRVVYQQVKQALKKPYSPDNAKQWRRSLKSMQSRIHWRDHFIQRLESEPDMEFRAVHPAYRQLAYNQQQRDTFLSAWARGCTGYPMVDATMRCLAQTGFVNFRMRAMTVSFACHILRLDWRWIHPHLARVFRDYEPGIHFSQLQMQAGVTGINTLRVYSPLRQLMVHDAEMQFVHRWVPELREASILDVTMNQLERHDYPAKLVDFASASARTREEMYGMLKRYQGSALTKAVVKTHGSRRKRRRKKKLTRR